MTINRNKKFISIITFLSVFFSIVYSFTSKKIWEGEFQIVLDGASQENSISNKIRGLPTLESDDPLETQVEFLKSPLVLSKVFEFVKKEKSLEDYQKSSLRFKDWKNNSLDIKLEKGNKYFKYFL